MVFELDLSHFCYCQTSTFDVRLEMHFWQIESKMSWLIKEWNISGKFRQIEEVTKLTFGQLSK